MTSHDTSTLPPHVVCLMSQVVSEWCVVVCWYKCVTVRACEQVLHWRRDPSPLTKEGLPHYIHPVVSACGSVDWPHPFVYT